MLSFETVIDSFATKRIVVVGDVMLDRFIYGDVGRISPEAPAPVIRAGRPEEILGGAGNVARNIVALGATCDLVAVVGQDEAAGAIAAALMASGRVTPHLVSSAARMTTVKTRFVATLHNTHLLRADWEDTRPISTDLEAAVIAKVAACLAEADALILSDYAKGVLTEAVIAGVIAAARALNKPVIVDPKGAAYGRYRDATALTPNLTELSQALGRAIPNETLALEAAALELIDVTGCDVVLVTRSERGVMIVDRAGSHAYEATARRVIDVSGAGDTVAASFALALVCAAGPANAARLANAAAGLVVAKKGTALVSADDLRDVFLSRPHVEIRSKIFATFDTAAARVLQWQRDGLVVGFTNGCFDLLHPGHIALLAEARSRCDRLVLGLNSDQSVKRLKGPTRPIQNEAARATVLAALAFVDGVILFGEDTPLDLITALTPDVLIKGADYRIDQVVGREVVEAHGGKVVLVDLVPESSTTRLVATIKADAEARGRAMEGVPS